MFDFFFKYPPAVFSKGQFVLLGSWPAWALGLCIAAAAGGLGWVMWSRRQAVATAIHGRRAAGIWLLQTALIALILLMLWQPAISVATLKPQQNIIAVLVDDSRSMAISNNGLTRREQAVKVLNDGLLKDLEKRFQVRLYRMSDGIRQVKSTDQLSGDAPASRIGESLKQVVAEAGTLPIGAVVMLTDGADNAGGIDLQTIAEVRGQRVPVHTIGFGREKFDRDVEITDVILAPRALADSRLSAQVTFRQNGYVKGKGRLTVRESGKTLASREVVFRTGGTQQTESVGFNAGAAGVKNLQISIEPLPGEENAGNNSISRLVNVQSARPRILYIEGEPRWEFKFIRRAIEADRSLDLVSMLRTTQNKVYRQGIKDSKELEQGFPATVEELFGYQGLIIGGVEAAYFTTAQQELIRQFVDRRGGGILFLGGRAGLSDGGYQGSVFAELLPVMLPEGKGTFRREPATSQLTPQGFESLICRLEEDAGKNAERWKKLPYLMNYQEVGGPKPGAVVLAELKPGNRAALPLLVTQNYGRGRSAVFATGGSWRWQMQQDNTDQTHEMFWQQLLRWLAADTPGHVSSSTPNPVLADDARLSLRADVRDKSYLPASDARVEARIMGPEGVTETIELTPDAGAEGTFAGEWRAEKPGSYVAEIRAKRGEEEVGRDVLMFRREDGVAENFRAEQNRELLERLSSQTGGQYYRPDEAGKLAAEIAYSEAGISVRETRDLWNMPVVFLLALLLRSAEWLLRRKWGVV